MVAIPFKPSPTLAFVFPGQGSQYEGMGKTLVDLVPAAASVFQEAREVLGWDVGEVCFGSETQRLHLTEYTQPAILVTALAAWRALEAATQERWGVSLVPGWVAGHSLGEYTALVVAGGMALGDALPLVHLRGRLMQEAVPEGEGMMAAILGLEVQEVERLCQECPSGLVAPANYNCPGQIVVAGRREAVTWAMERARERGARRVVPLSVSVPSHCPSMEPAAQRFAKALARVSLKDLEVPLVSNVDAQARTKALEIREALARQLTHPVRWEQGIRRMLEGGCRGFVEIGPGKVLTGLVRRIAQDQGVRVQLWHVEDPQSLEQTLEGLASFFKLEKERAS